MWWCHIIKPFTSLCHVIQTYFLLFFCSLDRRDRSTYLVLRSATSSGYIFRFNKCDVVIANGWKWPRFQKTRCNKYSPSMTYMTSPKLISLEYVSNALYREDLTLLRKPSLLKSDNRNGARSYTRNVLSYFCDAHSMKN